MKPQFYDRYRYYRTVKCKIVKIIYYFLEKENITSSSYTEIGKEWEIFPIFLVFANKPPAFHFCLSQDH